MDNQISNHIFNKTLLLGVKGSAATIVVRYPIFQKYEELIIGASEGDYKLDVKLGSHDCEELGCAMCTNDYEEDTWVEYEPSLMEAGVRPFEVVEFRKAYDAESKHLAVETLLKLGWTKEGEQWKPPIGHNIMKVRQNITRYLQKVFEEEGDSEATPHINYLAAMAEDIQRMVETGLSADELRTQAKERANALQS